MTSTAKLAGLVQQVGMLEAGENTETAKRLKAKGERNLKLARGKRANPAAKKRPRQPKKKAKRQEEEMAEDDAPVEDEPQVDEDDAQEEEEPDEE